MTNRSKNIGTDVAVRLMNKLVRKPSGCWEWQGFRGPRGYGQIGLGSRKLGLESTHRMAWMIYNEDEVPEGFFVCHKCDNPPCCNPHHLYAGTPQQNISDSVSRGRNAKGDMLPQTKLDLIKAREIHALRESGWKQRRIAERFGISQGHVSEILAGRYWNE